MAHPSLGGTSRERESTPWRATKNQRHHKRTPSRNCRADGKKSISMHMRVPTTVLSVTLLHLPSIASQRTNANFFAFSLHIKQTQNRTFRMNRGTLKTKTLRGTMCGIFSTIVFIRASIVSSSPRSDLATQICEEQKICYAPSFPGVVVHPSYLSRSIFASRFCLSLSSASRDSFIFCSSSASYSLNESYANEHAESVVLLSEFVLAVDESGRWFVNSVHVCVCVGEIV